MPLSGRSPSPRVHEWKVVTWKVLSKKRRKAKGDFRYDLPFKDAKNRLMVEFERAYWDAKLKNAEGNISQVARDGGIHRKSLEYLIKKLNITVERSG